jgi:intein/homing endonuclease
MKNINKENVISDINYLDAVIGFLIGDGSFETYGNNNASRWRVRFKKEDKDLFFNDILDKSGLYYTKTTYEAPNGLYYRYNIGSSKNPNYNIFKTKKELVKSLKVNNDNSSGLLSGLIASDGSITTSIHYHTLDKYIANFVKRLFNLVFGEVKISKSKDKMYDLYVKPYNEVVIEKLIFRDYHKKTVNNVIKEVKTDTAHINEISDAGYDFVYNLTVADNHTFVVNDIFTNNCILAVNEQYDQVYEQYSVGNAALRVLSGATYREWMSGISQQSILKIEVK